LNLVLHSDLFDDVNLMDQMNALHQLFIVNICYIYSREIHRTAIALLANILKLFLKLFLH